MQVQSVPTRALLICRDVHSIESLCHCTQQLSIQTEICADIASAVRKLCHSKFEAIIVDLSSDPGALELITKLHAMTSHKKAVIFAISGGAEQTAAAFHAGATFALDKSLAPATVLRTLRAAYPMLVAERRRYFRYPLDLPVFLKKDAGPESKARTVNLSEAGMGILSPETLSSGDHIHLRICLPNTANDLALDAEVCWTNAEGQAGVAFERVSSSAKECLQNWLSARFEECTPPLVEKS